MVDAEAKHDLRRVLYNFTARNENELTIQVGEPVLIEQGDQYGWTFGKRRDGRRGFFPSVYVRARSEVAFSNVYDEAFGSCNAVQESNSRAHEDFWLLSNYFSTLGVGATEAPMSFPDGEAIGLPDNNCEEHRVITGSMQRQPSRSSHALHAAAAEPYSAAALQPSVTHKVWRHQAAASTHRQVEPAATLSELKQDELREAHIESALAWAEVGRAEAQVESAQVNVLISERLNREWAHRLSRIATIASSAVSELLRAEAAAATVAQDAGSHAHAFGSTEGGVITKTSCVEMQQHMEELQAMSERGSAMLGKLAHWVHALECQLRQSIDAGHGCGSCPQSQHLIRTPSM
mmetsp:Transcript_71216/g.118359  ORF Transcript_71216/g.118359 Transcript_71216/m.118359 type:complete len:348 (+) Transcript_71216:126-1169(+)